MSRRAAWGISAAYVASLAPAWRRFSAALADPQRAQLSRLHAIVAASADSAFGREHQLDRVSSVAQFQQRVPVSDYDSCAPWIDRVAAGEQRVLTSEPVRMMEVSGGSTAANKLIPYTDGLLSEFAAATNPWLFDMYSRRRDLWGTRSYWAISPVVRRQRMTCGGVPIGIEDDTEYFGPMRRWALQRMLAVSSQVAQIPGLAAWRTETCAQLLAADDLGIISVWSPTFLTLLMEAMESELDALLARLPTARAAQIAHALDLAGGTLTGELLWPRLGLISCWTDGASEMFLPALRRWFPSTAIQPKGLLATEGVVSVPMGGAGDAAVLAVGSHFLEFVDLEHPSAVPLLAHELRPGASYSPLLTTSGGLYRYHLKDVVECVGRFRATPLVRFQGKLESVSDLCGEKLSAHQVERALRAACGQAGITVEFAVLGPVGGTTPGYRLYVESLADDAGLGRLTAMLDVELRESHHYDYCRRLGQLRELEPVRVSRGVGTYCAELTRDGRRFGSIKPMHIDVHGVAERAFAGQENRGGLRPGSFEQGSIDG